MVLISLDTLRADAVGAAGNGRSSLTPRLDRFAQDAVVFRRAVAPMPFTLPAHMTMFTGLHPRVHRVTTPNDRLGESIPTLPEILRQAGYRTIGWMTNEWLKADFGFGRGFDSYRQVRHRLTYSPRVNARARQTLAESDGDPRPLFLFLHYMDPHSDFSGPGPFEDNRLPYYSPAEFRADLEPAGYDGECDTGGNCATDFLVAADRDGRQVPAEQIGRIRRLYEAGVRYVDRDVGKLLASLRETGLYDQALIIVTSDHGEEFREHGLFLHSQTYDESILVPLLIKLPGSRFAKGTVDVQVELSDLLPTILEVTGVTVTAAIQGRSLLPLIEDDPALGRDEILVQDKLRRTRFALRTPHYKLIHDLETGHSELYDLGADGSERNDLSAELPQRAERMRRKLVRLLRNHQRLAHRLAENAQGGGSVLDREERTRLRSLGYLD